MTTLPTTTNGASSNGYEVIAAEFMAHRDSSAVGVANVRAWARKLRPGAAILDLGCGSGVPIAAALMDDGFDVHGIDASPSLAAAFRDRFPSAHVAVESVEDSSFFHRTFDAVIAIGLIFLLSADQQARLIERIAGALNHNGRFLFTAPSSECIWTDLLTGQQSLSLGAQRYAGLLANAGLSLVEECQDEGGNHYYGSCKESTPQK